MESLDELKRHLPPYLLPEQKEQLFQELKGFPAKLNYYLHSPPAEILQGDAWGSIRFFSPGDGAEQSVKGLILSNTCDISPENARAIPARVLFSPILRLDKYLERIESVKGKAATDALANNIRQQRVTALFYLPESEAIGAEAIVSLDNVISLPVKTVIEQNAEKVFTLSQSGFYLFLIKISIHFTRFQEGIARF